MGETKDAATPAGLFSSYKIPEFFCELTHSGDQPDPQIELIRKRLDALSAEELNTRAEHAARELYNLGITFTVYTERDAIDRILPFDLIPRILRQKEWRTVEAGVKQRVRALNCFLHDIYHDQKALKDGIIPAHLVLGNPNYCALMKDVDVPGGTYVHISGTDLVRDEHGDFLVLEDNARTPSGVSYVIENRHTTLRVMPDITAGIDLMPVDGYGMRLKAALVESAPSGVDDPQVVLLSPGIYNSA
ncbi:MAG: circularly permuted type 2 ATP-grasp protein, partial [Acetobacter sp.]|nr:circularly permuted type 2 ATP-grasp protein [Acetobacter sp.]